MVMEYGKELKVIHILANGLKVNHMALEFIFGQMVINMKVNGLKI